MGISVLFLALNWHWSVFVVDGIHGTIIADKGLISADYKNELYKFTGINLQTAARSNMEEKRWTVGWAMKSWEWRNWGNP